VTVHKSISFTRTDSIPSHIENAGKELADHFKVRRPYVPDFCKLIMTSKRWKQASIQKDVDRWAKFFNMTSGRKNIIDIVKRAFLSCVDDDEITVLRGVMVEALVIGCNGGTNILTKSHFGWGARVDIHLPTQKIEIKYTCKAPIDSACRRRSTVDFGSWNGRHGKFYECKAQPAGIGCKEVNYMKKLKNDLTDNEVSHEIFFVCAESRESVQMRLEDLGLGPIYKPYGYEDLKMMMPAS
jgi:hypothetical protein